jgi:hypothetical protein
MRSATDGLEDINVKIVAIEEHWNSAGIRDALDRLQGGRETKASPSTPWATTRPGSRTSARAASRRWTPPGSTSRSCRSSRGVTALVIHVLPLVALMVFLVPALAGSSRRRGVSVAAVIALAFGLFSAVFSITHPHAVVGVHDLNDVLPIAILDAGALLWLVRGRRRSTSKIDRTTA